MKNEGLAWHLSHDILLEYCYDYKGRVMFIERNKPKHEIPIRLQLLQFIKGELPDEVVKAACKFAKSPIASFPQGYSIYFRRLNALRRVIKDNQSAIEVLHVKECPNCCWNGKELVFSKEPR